MHTNTSGAMPVSVVSPSPSMNEDLESNTTNEETSHENLSRSMVKRSDSVLVTNNINARFQMLRIFMTNLRVVLLGTKLVVLFPAVPLAVAADFYKFGRVSIIYKISC